MKAVFPDKGIIVVTKDDVDKLHNFYTDNLVNSKLFSIYDKSNYSIQVGNLNYLPKKSTIILENAHLLTPRQLHQIVANEIAKSPEKYNTQDYDNPLDDNFILDNPFFKTLTPLN